MANETTNEKPAARRLVPVLVNRESNVQIPTERAGDGSIDPSSILFLTPGYNLVDEKRWVSAKKNPLVLALLKEKIKPATAAEESPEKVGHCIMVEGKAVDADSPLVALSEREAIDFVAETFQVPLLKKLLEQEGRATVTRALRAQVDKIEKPKQEAKQTKS